MQRIHPAGKHDQLVVEKPTRLSNTFREASIPGVACLALAFAVCDDCIGPAAVDAITDCNIARPADT